MSDSPLRPRATGRTTLADVARDAGVSPITVSRALRGERAVDPALVERVRLSAHKLGYVPDPAARALASRRSSQVVVLVPLLSNQLFVDLLEAAQGTLRAAGYQTLVGITHYDAAEEEQLLRELLLHRPAGLLITGWQHSQGTRQLLAASEIPCVHLMELEPAGTGGDTGTAPGRHCVGFSQADAAAALTEHLLQRGRRRIAFAAAQLDARTLQRLEGWRLRLQREGLHEPALEWLDPSPSSMALGGDMFARIRSEAPEVDAIFFNNDDLAHGALLQALRLQVQVPQQVAVVGFNDLPGSDQTLPPLTTVRTPRADIGRQAAQRLLALLRGEPVTPRALDVGYELVVRASS